ncbi:MAG: Asp-tRNA(Asn)/Glu-tRNA(Gln) amidotransferase subunit GatC [Candidatus Spechtbacterales bacterium]
MKKLTKQEVEHIAHLARVEMPAGKLDYYAEELSAVLKYVEKLNEVDTKDAEPKAHAADLASVFREDAERSLSENERAGAVKAIVSRFPFVQKNFARVKSVFSKER